MTNPYTFMKWQTQRLKDTSHASNGRVRLNLYGTRPACKIYHDELTKQFQSHVFHASDADPCLYMIHSATGTISMAVATDYLLVPATIAMLLEQFKTILRRSTK